MRAEPSLFLQGDTERITSRLTGFCPQRSPIFSWDLGAPFIRRTLVTLDDLESEANTAGFSQLSVPFCGDNTRRDRFATNYRVSLQLFTLILELLVSNLLLCRRIKMRKIRCWVHETSLLSHCHSSFLTSSRKKRGVVVGVGDNPFHVSGVESSEGRETTR